MKTLLVLVLFLNACGLEEVDMPAKHEINPDTFTVEEVQLVMENVYQEYETQYPNVRLDVEKFGYVINLTNNPGLYNRMTKVCGPSMGCTIGNVIWVNTNGWDCLASSTLSHEFQHLMFNAYERDTASHPYPDFSRVTRDTLETLKTTHEWHIINASINELCTAKDLLYEIDWFTKYCVE